MASAVRAIAVLEGEAPSKRDMTVSGGQESLHVKHECSVLGVPAAGAQIQVNQVGPSAMAAILANGLPMKKGHVESRKQTQ